MYPAARSLGSLLHITLLQGLVRVFGELQSLEVSQQLSTTLRYFRPPPNLCQGLAVLMDFPMKSMQAVEEKDIPDSITLGQLKALIPSNPKPRVSSKICASRDGRRPDETCGSSNQYMISGTRMKTRSPTKSTSSTHTLSCRRSGKTCEHGRALSMEVIVLLDHGSMRLY